MSDDEMKEPPAAATAPASGAPATAGPATAGPAAVGPAAAGSATAGPAASERAAERTAAEPAVAGPAREGPVAVEFAAADGGATPPSGEKRDGAEPVPAESDLDNAPAAGGRSIGRPAPAGMLIGVLLALLGFTLVVQLRSNDADHGLATARQEDLVRILSDLEAQDSRLLSEIRALEATRQQLSSGVQGREAALAEASKRSKQLGLLAGTVPGSGPGLEITMTRVKAADILNAVQELRGSGGEVMQLSGDNGAAVRIVASTYFVDAQGGGIIADDVHLTGTFRLLVIGPAGTMSTALQIPGGVVASVKNDGGSVTMDSRSMVDVTEVRKATALQYARPVS